MEFRKPQAEIEAIAAQIQMLLLDVDGVLTDGRLYFSNAGEETKAFHTLDGHGIKMLMSVGVQVGIITGRKSDLVARRCADLGITLLLQGREDKFDALQEIIAERPVKLEHIAFAGDDLPDLPVIRGVGLGFTVPGGHAAVQAAAAAITESPGGRGAVREITDFLLHAQGKYDAFLR